MGNYYSAAKLDEANRKTGRKLAVAAFAGTLLFAAATAASAQATLQKALATHLRKTNEDFAEDPAQREVYYRDMNGDGTPDAVVLYMLEARQGLTYGQNLAVFLRKKGGYHLAADEVVSGKFFRGFLIKRISSGIIFAQTSTCPAGDSTCRNPVKKQVQLTLVGAKLRER
ncbi:MAG: hypothetical protein ACRYFX_05365 [Janthinobacterium lividum]